MLTVEVERKPEKDQNAIALGAYRLFDDKPMYYGFGRFVSVNVWGNLPSPLQRKISKTWGSIYDKSISRILVKPYCYFTYKDAAYLDQFCSASGKDTYSSFQDFFTRVYKVSPSVESQHAWPCEGYLCDYGVVGEMPETNVKGDRRNIKTVFGELGDDIPDDYHFANVFLHTKNYHRIHSPINGRVKATEHISGDLVLLRPWVYKHDPSLPAMRNERVNLLMEDELGQDWCLSIIGGPGVGTIKLEDHIKTSGELKVGEEIGKFLIGSTCCLAMPKPLGKAKIGDHVFVGQQI